MKKLIIAAVAATCAVSVFAQGTVQFNNRTAAGTSHVWGPSSSAPTLSLTGNGATDSPVGAVNYAGSGMTLVGTTLTAGQQTFAQLIGATGSSQVETSLVPQGAITTFRTGSGAGFLAVTTATLSTIAKDAPWATLALAAWDNSSGLYPTWTEASVAWAAGTIAAGRSAAVNVGLIGGDVNTAPQIPFTSFNMYFVGATIPEPSSFALAGLGAAALLNFRRRK